MSNVNVWACAVAVVAAFAASAVYYGILGEPAATEVRRPAWATPIVELARNALLVVLVAGLVSRLDPGFTGALLLAAGLFLVPLVLLAVPFSTRELRCRRRRYTWGTGHRR